MANRSLGQPWRSVFLIDCCRSILTIAILLGSSAWGPQAAAQVFGPPAALNPNAATDSGDDFSPQVTTDGAGNWLAVWDSTDSLGATLGTDADILVSRSSDTGVSWTVPAALNANAATDSGDDFSPQVATDGAGYWLAVWASDDSLSATLGTDADILISRSSNAGASWTALAAFNSNAATDSGFDFSPQVTTDGSGNWVVVWNSDDSLGTTLGTDTDILYSTRSIRPHSALGYRPPALGIIVPAEELPMRTGTTQDGNGATQRVTIATRAATSDWARAPRRGARDLGSPVNPATFAIPAARE